MGWNKRERALNFALVSYCLTGLRFNFINYIAESGTNFYESVIVLVSKDTRRLK